MFSCSSRGKWVFWISSYLNILCVNSGKQYHTKNYQIIWAIKTGPFLKVCNSCIWWCRKVIRISVFSTLSEVRLLSFILSQLNILCTSLVKPRYGENDNSIHPLFTVHTLRPLTCSPTYCISSKRSVPYIKTFVQYFITCSTVVLQCYRRQAIPMEQGKIRPSVTL